MKAVAIHLRLETASHRKRLTGIFRHLSSDRSLDIRIVQNEDDFCALLASESGRRLAGIISGVPHSEKVRRSIRSSGANFVGIGVSENDICASPGKSGCILNDNEGIGRTAAEYFLSLGNFRSYAFVPDAHKRPWSTQRGESFAATLVKAGKTCEFPPDGSGAEPLKRFLSSLPRPAAVLAAWDGQAADVIHAAHEAGLRIPEDISVLGVDDDTLICEHTVPALSSIRTDAEGMGESAAKMLTGLMSGNRKTGSVLCGVLGVIERGSTHSPAPAVDLIRRAKAFIKSETANDISPSDVARYLKISRRLLDLRFKQFESRSVAETIAGEKLKRTMELLPDRSIPIKDVFIRSGFGNITYATKIFKEATGLSPTAWRNEHADANKAEAAGNAVERLSDLDDNDTVDLRKLAVQLTPDAKFDPTALRRSIRDGGIAVFVIRRRSRIAAAATAVFFQTPTGMHCRIEDVIVDSRSRGKGLGRRIMTGTMDMLRESGVGAVELTSRPSRVEANALYRALGFNLRETNVYEYRF